MIRNVEPTFFVLAARTLARNASREGANLKTKEQA
jgi:hypothetical protein